MAGTNWLEVGGIAQLAAAFGTLILASGTIWLAKRTHEVASKTEGLVTASLREAEATESLAIEAKTDRQLAWRPQLQLVEHDQSNDWFMWTIRNSGAGPAMQVVCLAREMANVANWAIHRAGDLRPGESAHGEVFSWKDGGALHSPFEGFPGTGDREVVTVVLLCADVLGRRFRFGFVQTEKRSEGLSPVLKVLPPDLSILNDKHPAHIGWADEPLIWG